MKKELRRIFLLTLLVFINVYLTYGCQCPYTDLSLKECDKYEIIFKGKVISVTPCNNKLGEAIFELQELYKGNSTKQFKVLFECDVECAAQFNEGEEWIIYSRYKQIDNAKMDWCSRSRKFFKNEREDFYTVTYGNDYYDEVKFLREKLGNHRFLQGDLNRDDNRNRIPKVNETIVLVLCSLVAIVLFYWVFDKFFKS